MSRTDYPQKQPASTLKELAKKTAQLLITMVVGPPLLLAALAISITHELKTRTQTPQNIAEIRQQVLHRSGNKHE